MEKKTVFTGAATALITPLTEEGIDYAAFERLINWQIEEGINGLTLSNAMHLSSWTNSTVELPFDEELFYDELMKRVATSRRKTEVKEAYVDTANTFAGTK